MPHDELRQPLRKMSTAGRLWARRPDAIALAAIIVSVGFVAGGTWIVRQPHPRLAGEPVVTAFIPPVEELKTAATDAAPADTAAPEDIVAEPAPEDVQPEIVAPSTIEIADGGPKIIVARSRPLKAAPLAAVTEAAKDGPLPKIGPNGKTPAEAYAQITPMAITASDQPKIAILLGGMGLNAKLTQKAIRQLPGDVSFAFAPYGSGLQDQVNKARAQGHEVMLQLPMEPMGYPANDPGPNTLLAEALPDDNLKALHWNMSRFAGYIGITNYMGARFLSNPQSFQPVAAELRARGLLFLEDANVEMSATAAVAQVTGLKSRHAEMTIDANPDAKSIRAALAALEAEARKSGVAIGTGSGLEITIDTVADWAAQLESRGILLIPVSAAYRGRLG
ncbi:MAG: divergent polysaccharide deacetylase family protein [Rhizobiales bacterium]|nr:divergent polysaccharide deacetylase family protein [Hyphomicrobiales bacterium]MBI3673560.1 divergent polysaccharide deacetylase family protein [Hyphomicrobiales bacterium]